MDTHGAIKGSYMDGRFDSLLCRQINRLLIDARLQLFARRPDGRQSQGCRGDRTSTGRFAMMVFSRHIRSPMNWGGDGRNPFIWSCSITNGSRCSTVP